MALGKTLDVREEPSGRVKRVQLKWLNDGENYWSGIRESNSRLDLGKVAYYHYTNPALSRPSTLNIYSMRPIREQALDERCEKAKARELPIRPRSGTAFNPLQ